MQYLRSFRNHVSRYQGHYFWRRFLIPFSWVWHIIWWVWSSVIVGGLIVGVLISYATTGTPGLADPRNWIVIHVLLTHPIPTIATVTIACAITLLAYLAHRQQRKVLKGNQQTHHEALVDIAKGVSKALEVLNNRPEANLSRSPAAETVNQGLLSPEVICNVPFRRNPFFTGREDILLRLHASFKENQTTALMQPQAISGLGGIGKTQIAVEYAYRYLDDYQTILWARSDSHEALTSDFVIMARLLQLREKDAQDQNTVVTAVKRWLDNNSGWLLILDNADDLNVISHFLPKGAKGHILLTTRAQALGGLAQNVEIEKMEPKESIFFLFRRAKIIAQNAQLDATSAADYAVARSIVLALDGLPLAIDQAGAYIEETACSLSNYLDLYQIHRAEILNIRGDLDSGHPESVATTWSLAFEKVQQANAAAVDLLKLCAFLAPDDISEEMFAQDSLELGSNLQLLMGDQYQLNKAIKELLKFSLLRRNANLRTLTVHRLVQAIIRDGLDKDTQRLWAQRAIRFINHSFPSIEVENWSRCERFLPHALACATFIKENDMAFPEAATLLNKAGNYLFARTRYREAEPFLTQALTIRERVLGFEHPDTAASLHQLGMLFRAQDKYLQAEPLLTQALTIRERVLGFEHPDTAASFHQLAWLYERLGKYEQAEPFYHKALGIRERELGLEHPETVTTLNHLGWLNRVQGNYQQSELLYQRALSISKQLPQIGYPVTAASLHGLGLLYYVQGKYEQAEPFLQQALVIRKRVLGPEQHATTSSLNDLGLLYYTQGKYKEAEPLLQEALALREQALGPEHRGTATSLNHLATLYKKRGKCRQAEPLLKRALAIRERALGIEHPLTVSTLENYASLLRQMKREREAIAIESRANAIRAKYLSSSSPQGSNSS